MKNTSFILLIVIFIVQLFFPLKMIFESEQILTSGKEYKFLLEPVDPSDPFRGKYITLNFRANEFSPEEKFTGERQMNVFVHLTKDSAGFAKISNVSLEQPGEHVDFVKAKVNYIYGDGNMITIQYPFENFYMEESKAQDAEKAYQNIVRDTIRIAYGRVFIKNGDAVLSDVILDDVPIKEYVKSKYRRK